MTYNEFVKQELKWEEYRQAHPTCDNCVHYYWEYGFDCCRLYDCPPEDEVEDVEKDKCSSWK